jgi:hypothetical protein
VKLLALAAALAAVLSLAACGHSATDAAATASAAATHAPSLPPGCQQRLLVTSAIRNHLQTEPSDVKGALRQLNDLRDSMPAGQQQVDVSLAALALARFQLDAAMGQPAASDAKAVGRALSKISRDCGPDGARPVTAAPASPTSTVSAKQQFINSVRTAGLGSKDIAGETDRQLLALGRRECKIMTDSFANGANGYRSLIRATMTGVPDATEGQAAIWVDSAIRDLCPAWSSQLPAGAP